MYWIIGACIVHGIKCSYSDTWMLSKHPGRTGYHFNTKYYPSSVDSSPSPLHTTISSIYTSSKISYILYNDHPPEESEQGHRAHSKGVLAFDDHHGFWIIHSIPRFPNKDIILYDYTFGQSALCISFNIEDLDSIIRFQMVNRPYVYEYNIDNTHNPLIFSWIIEEQYSHDTTHIEKMKQFMLFSKSKHWKRDLFEDLIAPYYESDMNVLSWQNGATKNVMPSFCKPEYSYNILNIEQLCLTSCWSHTHEHSKWAITDSMPVVCIGDINRQYSQEHRGGGIVCIRHTKWWKFFKKSIEAVSECNKFLY